MWDVEFYISDVYMYLVICRKVLLIKKYCTLHARRSHTVCLSVPYIQPTTHSQPRALSLSLGWIYVGDSISSVLAFF